jgi:KUP system potassium uptake protein
MHSQQEGHSLKGIALASLMVGALGVVYGDIGTSPLYALNQTFFGPHPLAQNLPNILGVLSLMLWSLLIVVSIKYIGLIMKADSYGEGGVFAMLSIIRQNSGKFKKRTFLILTALIIFGAALLYGDGIITPSISVLSAVEGLQVAAPTLHAVVLPITLAILAALFTIQRYGTDRVGKFFGPIMIVWFLSLIAIAIPPLLRHPVVLLAINPLYAIQTVIAHGASTLFILGAVVLCVTGGEALYADMGHFGRKAIGGAWFSLVYPALIVNYLGQGARLLDPTPITNGSIFYNLVPTWGLIPMIVLATLATVIASQALISGVFSLTQQAIGLEVLPRLKIIHTNPDIQGQIYVPAANWVLFFGCVMLVLGFQTSNNLAAAYGMAVTGTMAITTLSFYFIARDIWGWNRWLIGSIAGSLLFVDLVFFASNTLKFLDGGFVPVAIALYLYAVMRIWQWGRRYREIVATSASSWTIRDLVQTKHGGALTLLPRTVVLMSARPITTMDDPVPVTLQGFTERWGALPKHLIFLTVVKERVPYISNEQRFTLARFNESPELGTLLSVQVHYGYMEDPDIRSSLVALHKKHLDNIPQNSEHWLILVGRERFITKMPGLLNRLKLAIFRSIHANTKSAVSYFGDLDSDAEVIIVGINI